MERRLLEQTTEATTLAGENINLKERVLVLQAELEAAKSDEEGKRSQLEKEAVNVAQLHSQIEAHGQELAKTATEKSSLTDRMTTLEADLAQARSAERDSRKRLEELVETSVTHAE